MSFTINRLCSNECCVSVCVCVVDLYISVCYQGTASVQYIIDRQICLCRCIYVFLFRMCVKPVQTAASCDIHTCYISSYQTSS